MNAIFPDIFAVNGFRSRNPIRQLSKPGFRQAGQLVSFSYNRSQRFLFRASDSDEETLIVSTKKNLPEGHLRIIQASVDTTGDTIDLSDGIWLRHPALEVCVESYDYQRVIQRVIDSWNGAFAYVQENVEKNIVGLRSPQIGAIHAVHAHWAVSEGPATVVMPTGTGKTETMLSVLVSAPCTKVLVIVPTDALRTQLSNKFITLGILRVPNCTILRETAQYPVVCTLHHVPRSEEEIDAIFGRSQIVVATSSVVALCKTAVQERIAFHCSHLFVDEAHHAEAPTWSAFKEKFRNRRILQFTATPFREDGKPLDGKIIFKYPLRKAQHEKYFKPIQFKPVTEFNPKLVDLAIATKAIVQLRVDESKGHILMARVGTVEHANKVFQIYNQYPEFNPVQLHTGIKSNKEREQSRQQIISGKSRIVVCVDMLGEGFDLPELKIAAFHDIRKTLAVTLQLAGRFTRTRSDLGDATFIANTADVDVQDELRKLYSRDPDWNILLPELSEKIIAEQISLQEFLNGFTDFTDDIPLNTVKPATSMVVYKTSCSGWSPESFRDGIPAIDSCERVYHTHNITEHTLIVVTARRLPVVWTEVETLFRWDWELYVAIWSPDQNLLFINNSTNSGNYKSLAQALAGETATLIKGQDVFRSFAGVKRLRLQNVGLTERLGRNVRYTGRMGADVESGVSDIQRRRAQKTVLAGVGYEDRDKTSVGASRKGRIWSHRREHVDKMIAWCKRIGQKLLDETINTDEILKGTLESKLLSERPHQMPISADWPEEMYKECEAHWLFVIDNQEYYIHELNIEVVSPDAQSPLRIKISTEEVAIAMELEFFDDEGNPDFRFVMHENKQVEIRYGRTSQPLTEFFYQNPPIIWFANGASLEGNDYTELKEIITPYEASRIEAWDWNGTNIRKESQGKQKEQDSIQAKVINELRGRDFQMIIDDDGSGEVADVVAVQLVGSPASPSQINVEFYHCKYSLESTPGQRIEDLYAVCGQAQKSVAWMCSPDKRVDIFTHLLRREARRRELNSTSRYEVGDDDLLHAIREMIRMTFMTLKIFIVQPGVSKSRVTNSQLELMSVTENYLSETYQIPFGIITSK